MKYTNVEEIRKGFIRKGWNEDTTFSVVSEEEAKLKGYSWMLSDMKKGKMFFKMDITGNIFNDSGNIVMFNIPTI